VIDERAKRKKSGFWREMPVLLVVAILVAVVVRAFILQTFYIPSESMERTLEINDRVLVNKLVYNFRPPQRGEIVVFEAPMLWRSDPREKDFIKRIIGVGGDRIVCCDAEKRITVNGMPLDEPYIYQDDAGKSDLASEEPFDVVVPPKRIWVMGDHRAHSGDSREKYTRTKDTNFATIEEDSVVGRAFVVFWPFPHATWLDVPPTFAKVPATPQQ